MTGIYQDWNPVVIHNRTYRKKIEESFNKGSQKPKIDYSDGEIEMPKRIEYTNELTTAMQNARKAKRLSQSDLAKQLNIDVKIISDIEAKKSPYNKLQYCSIMKKLGVDQRSLKDILI